MTTEQSQTTGGAPSDEAGGLPAVARVVGRIAHALQHELPAGDIAELRRLRPDDPAAPAFWKVAALYLRPVGFLGETGPALDRSERRWAALLNALAHLGPLHRRGARLGRALADAGLSELRFVRLLRAHDDALLDAVRTAAQYLASKAVPADTADFAWLLLTDGNNGEQTVRRRIARDYYGHGAQTARKE